MTPRLLPSILLFCCATVAFAEPEARKVPPPGIAVPDAARAELTEGAVSLGKQIVELREKLAGNPRLLSLVPDVEIFHKAVDWALRHDEFFDPKQIDAAKRELAMGADRANLLRDGKSPWAEQKGLVVRGYRSKIDGSVQPYGLVIPDSWNPGGGKPSRLDFWLHGRGEKLSELSFLEDRLRSRGEFAPENAITVHLYGRFCNANKFAGETDLFETLDSVQSRYDIDPNRLVVRGFSMGGASCWQFATHHAGLFAAAAPGAGFAETAEFFHVFDAGKTPPPWWEQVLWRWYDSTIYSPNLASTTLVAYSGEIDKQKQAADIMARFMEKEGLTLTHLIGPGVAHKYNPETKPKIEEIVSAAAEKGRDAFPERIRFTTYTLLYPRLKWIEVDGMAREWERADVDAHLTADAVEMTTKNVTALRISNPVPSGKQAPASVIVDGQKLAAGWQKNGAQFHREGEKWVSGLLPEGVRKRPELCGPIDHAFMSSFLMVRPTGKPFNELVGKWATSEMDHSVTFWRDVFRGDAPIKDDKAVSPDDIANSNLVLWGDPSSNAVLARIASKLPIQWTADGIKVGKETYAGANHVPLLIFPNPLNPKKYVVINSGVTFREQALANNSDQTPKLPDWAVIDVNTPADNRWPGLVTNAGFFDENWRLP